ncbi:MAG: hypothetical protein EPGJADBJ_04066 [Saprospiraceae bacterium]|nr:hypothetical protein [Saprospiraceae bacterium]
MKEVNNILSKLESHIKIGTFEQLESDKIELKSLADGSDWNELYKSVCAFLNTEGGIVIVGIREKNRTYSFSGYKGEQNEEEKIKSLSTIFTDENGERLILNEQFPQIEIVPFLDGRVCVIYIEKLPEDKKYVFLKGEAYCRKMTGDHKITPQQIQAHREYKEELASAYELNPVKGTTINDLDVDKLNDYIIRLNREVKVETLKADIPSAISFLTRKGFVRDGQPTLLGMLVCGTNVFDWVGGRCQVDAYVDSLLQVAQNKQVIKDNIFQLMENAVGFVYKNIQVGVSYEKGGSQLPEYPEKLIRETVNNALAHRDYSSDGFVNLIIKPNHSIEIRNPGRFRQKQLLQLADKGQGIRLNRIIPIAKARNPKIADILKTYDRWEGRGIGMASLTNACLENQIDVPYFILRPENVSLFIPKGKVLDDIAEMWLDSFDGYIRQKNNGRKLTDEERIVMSYFYKSEKLNREEKFTVLLTPDNNHFSVITNLEEKDLIFRLPQDSDYPIFLIDKQLHQTDFSDELRAFFGPAYDGLGLEYQDVLNVVWLFTKFSSQEKQVSANLIGAYLFFKKSTYISDAREYDNFRRKVRNIINRLEEYSFLIRKQGNKPDFTVNPKFIETSLSKG